MTVYLVDFENVRSGGLRGVEELSEGDKVVIFYSKNADAITFDVHMLLSKSKAEIETFRILRGGRNSLDFQLSTYLGYLVMENSYKNIVIISQDKGFLCATSFWEENQELCNCNIRHCKSIATSDVESSTSDEFDDGLTGKFIEKIDMRKLLCPQCKIAGLYVKNEKKERLLVYVSDEGEVVPRNLEENMEGFDLTIVYCLGCSWSGSPKKLVKR